MYVSLKHVLLIENILLRLFYHDLCLMFSIVFEAH